MSKKSDIYKDERFAHLLSNPRFKQLPKTESKVKIDKRFQGMFDDERFNVKQKVDKYGRHLNKKEEDLKKYYRISSGESSDEAEQEEAIPGNAEITSGNVMPKSIEKKLKSLEVDYIRGEGVLQSDSSDDESSEEEVEEELEHEWGELDQDAERTEDSSRRIACMHMDWDRIRAVDIMVLCNSFIPAGAGSVLSVKVSKN
jgi:hypothetical protein